MLPNQSDDDAYRCFITVKSFILTSHIKPRKGSNDKGVPLKMGTTIL